LDDGDIYVINPVGASSLETFITWTDVWMAWCLGVSLHVFLVWGIRWSGVSSAIYDDESRRRGATGSRQRTREGGGVMAASMWHAW
jgi:hypothetical protein